MPLRSREEMYTSPPPPGAGQAAGAAWDVRQVDAPPLRGKLPSLFYGYIYSFVSQERADLEGVAGSAQVNVILGLARGIITIVCYEIAYIFLAHPPSLKHIF